MKSSTARVREFRARERVGRRKFETEHDVDALERMLRAAGFLTVVEPEHADVEAALQQFEEWLIADHETRFDG